MALTEEQRAKLNAKAKQSKMKLQTPQPPVSDETPHGGMGNRKPLVGLVFALVVICVIYAVLHSGFFSNNKTSEQSSESESIVQEQEVVPSQEESVKNEQEVTTPEEPIVEKKTLSIGDTVDYYGKQITLVDAYRADPNSEICEYDDEGWGKYFFVFECVNNTREDWIIHGGFYESLKYDDYDTYLTSPRVVLSGTTINGERPWEAQLPPGKAARGYLCLQLLEDFERLEIGYGNQSYVLYNADLEVRDIVFGD